jgi:hypothetical protein
VVADDALDSVFNNTVRIGYILDIGEITFYARINFPADAENYFSSLQFQYPITARTGWYILTARLAVVLLIRVTLLTKHMTGFAVALFLLLFSRKVVLCHSQARFKVDFIGNGEVHQVGEKIDEILVFAVRVVGFAQLLVDIESQGGVSSG